jgi:hypothetical protein
MTRALKAVTLAQEAQPRDEAAVQRALADFNTHKDQFLQFANSIQVTTLAGKIHDRLQPSVGDGVLTQYGEFIMSAHRHLTAADSQRVRALNLFLEEYQALATWLKVERFLGIGGSSIKLVKPTLDQFFSWSAQQRNPAERNGLREPIPPNVVIDRGPDGPIESYSTAKRVMFTNVPGNYAWAPRAEPAWIPPVPPTVPSSVGRANAQRLDGFSGWRAPTAAELYGLFSRLQTRSPAAITVYITSLLGNTPSPGPFLWTSETKEQTHFYETSTHRVRCRGVDARVGVSTDALSSDARPRFNGFVKLDEVFRQAMGGLFVARNTGAVTYL